MARRYWLFKSDPGTFGWHDLEKARGRRAIWDGVRNYQARNLSVQPVAEEEWKIVLRMGRD